MTVLGEGNGTGYPAALDTRETQVDQPAANKTLVDANLLNDILRAIVGIQTELGINPASNYDDLVSSLFGTGTAVDSSTGATITIPTDGSYFQVSGSSNKTDISSAAIGTVCFMQFTEAMTLVHNTAKIVLGAGNKTTAAGDVGTFRCMDGTIWRLINWQPATSHQDSTSNPHSVTAAQVSLGTGDSPQFTGIELSHASANTLTGSGGDALIEGSILKKVGLETQFIPVEAMTPATTNGCAAMTLVESTTHQVNYNVMDFDATSDEHAHFKFMFPKGWNKSTVTFSFSWTTTATDTDGVAVGLQAVAFGNSDAIDTDHGTAIVVTDDNDSAAGDILTSGVSDPVTIAGSPAADEWIDFRVFRDVSDGNDDMTEDMRLVGVRLFWSTNASTDA